VDNKLILLGLDVIQSSPAPYQTDVDVNVAIRLVFNGELNENTVIGNLYVLEDVDRIYEGDGEIDVTKYRFVPGEMSQGDRVVLFSPSIPLTPGAVYIVYVPARSMKDILGKTLALPYIMYFSTEGEATLPPPQMVFPRPNQVTETVSAIVWKTLNADTYAIEVAKTPTFEHLTLSRLLLNPEPDGDGNISQDLSGVSLAEGLYYVRVRALKGLFGQPTQFFIKAEDRVPVSIDDSELRDIAEEIPQDLEVLEFFPENGFSNVALNVKTLYVRLNRILTEDEANSIIASVTSTLSDESDDGEIPVHGEIIGTWNVINDAQRDESFVVFTLNTL